MAGATTVKDLVNYLNENVDPDLKVKIDGVNIDLSHIKVVHRGSVELGAVDPRRNRDLES